MILSRVVRHFGSSRKQTRDAEAEEKRKRKKCDLNGSKFTFFPSRIATKREHRFLIGDRVFFPPFQEERSSVVMCSTAQQRTRLRKAQQQTTRGTHDRQRANPVVLLSPSPLTETFAQALRPLAQSFSQPTPEGRGQRAPCVRHARGMPAACRHACGLQACLQAWLQAWLQPCLRPAGMLQACLQACLRDAQACASRHAIC